MRAQRIKTGFHRIGVFLVIACMIPALLVVGVFLREVYEGRTDYIHLGIAGAWLPAAALAYGAARGLGWIVAGFAGDGN